jgi:transcriptional regulator with XRE-family HTH domain
VVKTLGTERHKALIALLIEKREAAGLTQSDLAAKLGEYQSFVARLESGQRRVDVVEFIALAEILGFDPKHALDSLMRLRRPTGRNI